MFIFSLLPLCTSDIIYQNGEIFEITLNISRNSTIIASISKKLEFTLNIDQNQTVTL